VVRVYSQAGVNSSLTYIKVIAMSVNKLLAEYEKRQRRARLQREFVEKFKPTNNSELVEQEAEIRVLTGKSAKSLLKSIGKD